MDLEKRTEVTDCISGKSRLAPVGTLIDRDELCVTRHPGRNGLQAVEKYLREIGCKSDPARGNSRRQCQDGPVCLDHESA